MSMSVNVQENWTIEPELMEMPPRRVVLSEFPDLNRPNPMLIYGAGGGVIVLGLVLLIVGLNTNQAGYTVFGVLLTLVGTGVIGFVGPFLTRRHMERSEHLAKNGVPVMARILSAENMSGDYRFGRSVTYQVSLPSGDMIHKHANADDRLLPSKIPANVTALMDVNSGDVELYCCLPYRIPGRPGEVGARSTDTAVNTSPTTTPVFNPGKMGTIDMDGVEQPTKRDKPEEVPVEATKPAQSGNAGLPWE